MNVDRRACPYNVHEFVDGRIPPEREKKLSRVATVIRTRKIANQPLAEVISG